MRLVLLVTIAVGILPTLAQADILTRCGASSGWSYFFTGRFVKDADAGWQKDGFSNGEILFGVNGKEPQILYRDGNGMRDAATEGAKLILMNSGNGFFVVLAAYAQSFEHYTFMVDARGHGEVVWGTVRTGDGISKSGLYRAECKAP